MTDHLNPRALEAAAKALYDESPWPKSSHSTESYQWEELTDEIRQAFLDEAQTTVTAYFAIATSIEYAGKHKYAGIETVDVGGYPFESADHVRGNYADHPNCTPMYRLATEWKELSEDMK